MLSGAIVACFLVPAACGSDGKKNPGAGGSGSLPVHDSGVDASSSGGAATGGAASGGAATGGAATGGADASGLGGNGGTHVGGAANAGDLYGAWQEICEAGQGGSCNESWQLRFGAGVLGGPETFVSKYGPCSELDAFISGTFDYDKDAKTLTLRNCNPPIGEGGAGGNGGAGANGGAGGENGPSEPINKLYSYAFERGGKRLTLSEAGGPTYTFERATTAPPGVLTHRLLDVPTIDCEEIEVFYQVVVEAEHNGFVESLAIHDQAIFTDEFFEYQEMSERASWYFYDVNDRGAQTASYPLPPENTWLYRIIRSESLEPLFGFGAEVNCDTGEVAHLAEYDFRSGHQYQRFASSQFTALDTDRVLEVSGASESITELLVTVEVTHPEMADVTLDLESPQGTQITLASGASGDGSPQGYHYTTFSDGAEVQLTDSVASFATLVVPEQALAAFDGEDPNGSWVLSVTDVEGEDSGVLSYFGISVR